MGKSGKNILDINLIKLLMKYARYGVTGRDAELDGKWKEMDRQDWGNTLNHLS